MKLPNFIVEVDYSQLEAVILAFLAQDKTLLTWFQEGKDIHTQTAMAIFGIEYPGAVSSQQRSVCKTIRYGAQYGAGVDKLYKSLLLKFPEMELSVVRRFYRQYQELHPEIIAFQEELVRISREEGYVEDVMTGRRITFMGPPDIPLVYNFPIQSAGAGLMNPATLRVHERLEEGEYLIAQVHDALLCEGPDPVRLATLMRFELERPVALKGVTHSFATDTKIGHDWGNCLEVKKRGQSYEVKKLGFVGSYEDCVLECAKELDDDNHQIASQD